MVATHITGAENNTKQTEESPAVDKITQGPEKLQERSRTASDVVAKIEPKQQDIAINPNDITSGRQVPTIPSQNRVQSNKDNERG